MCEIGNVFASMFLTSRDQTLDGSSIFSRFIFFTSSKFQNLGNENVVSFSLALALCIPRWFIVHRFRRRIPGQNPLLLRIPPPSPEAAADAVVAAAAAAVFSAAS